MKIRQGFVSNSSSSSFIIATDKKKKKIQATVEVDISPYIANTLKTIKELDEWFIEYHGWDDQPLQKILEDNKELRQDYHKYKEIIEKGKKILIGSFNSYGGEAVESMLCEEGLEGHLDKDIEIIENDGGY